MIAALLLLAVAAADAAIGLFELARSARRDRASALRPAADDIAAIILGVGAAAAVSAAGWLAVGLPPLVAAAVGMFAVAWVLAGQVFTVTGRGAPLLVSAVVLVAATACGAIISPTMSFDGPAMSALAEGTALLGQSVTPAVIVGVIAVALTLTRTSNLICRAALGRTLAAETPLPATSSRNLWAVMIGGRRVAAVVAAPAHGSEAVTASADGVSPRGLQGGRVIGPLERILIVALGLIGSQALIVGLLAAKGIVRFPEINADNRHGSKAEEFLVGSLVSWTLAGLSVALLAWLQNS